MIFPDYLRRFVSVKKALIVLFLLLTIPPPVRADTIYNYTYTGNTYDTFYMSGGYFPPPGPYFISISFEWGETLNLYNNLYAGIYAPIIISDGVHTLVEASAGGAEYNTGIYITSVSPLTHLPMEWQISMTGWDPTHTYQWTIISENVNWPGNQDDISGLHDGTAWAGAFNNPGTWSRTEVVPLPSTLLLFGSGLLALKGWRRFRKS